MVALKTLAHFLVFQISAPCLASFIPGKDCGIESPIKRLKKIPPGTPLEKLGCTFVEDKDSFQKHYRNKLNGNFVNCNCKCMFNVLFSLHGNKNPPY